MVTRASILALIAAATAAQAAGAAPWSAPRSVAVTGSPSEPVVALGGPDAAAVAYSRNQGRGGRIELRAGTVDRLGRPVIVDRDASHGLDSPALTFSGHVALVAWRRFQAPDARLIELASVSRGRVVSGPRALTGPPNAYEPAFPSPQLLTFWRRTAAYARTIENRRPGVTTRLPRGATFESQVATLPGGTRVAVWPAAGAIYASTQAPGAIAFDPPVRLSAPGGFARSPQLVVTSDGHAIALWAQSGGGGRALVSATRAPGGAFGPATQLTSPAADVFAVRAIPTRAGDVFVTFVSTAQAFGAGPLQALHVGPDGHGSPPQTITPPGERTRDAAVAVDSGAAYAAWATAGRVSRHSVRVVRVVGPIVGRVRTVSGSENVVSAAPAFAMTLRGRALLAYMVRSGGIRLVTRRAG